MIGASERAETTNRDLQSRDAERLHGVDRRSGLAAEKMNPVTGQTHEEGEAWLRPTVTEDTLRDNRATRSSDEIERRDRATSSSVSSLTKQTRSSDDGEIERRRRRDRAIITTSFGVEMSSLRLKLAMISNWGVGGAFILLFHTVVNPDPISPLIAEYVPFSSDKRYATTQVKAPPHLQKTGAVRVSTVSHGFVYEPYALHEKILWWRRCLYVTSGSLRSLYSTQDLAGVSVAVLNFLQRI
ncbi:unnamed protein product [Brassica oleracea var. botrytis]